jgi:hypothetical protein
VRATQEPQRDIVNAEKEKEREANSNIEKI